MELTSRLYETERDLRQMQGLLMEARSHTDDWHYIHIGELTFHFFMLLCHLNPRKHIRLWHDAEDRLAGYAMLGEGPSFDWQVAPQHEWRGIETEAWTWAETFLAKLRERNPEQWGGNLTSGARQDNGRRRIFLAQHGFRYSGEFAEVNMLRTLGNPIPEPVPPTGYRIHSIAGTNDAPKRAVAHREVWQPWTDGNISDEAYVSFMQLPAYQRDLDVIASAADGGVAAFVNGWIDPLNRIGELGSVGVVPAHRRRGLMRAVLTEVLRRMRARGMDRACVSTGAANIPAIRLYTSVGFEIVNQYLDYSKAA
jgi:ribosomal protein S18 acetylase RimI-like enzyme